MDPKKRSKLSVGSKMVYYPVEPRSKPSRKTRALVVRVMPKETSGSTVTWPTATSRPPESVIAVA